MRRGRKLIGLAALAASVVAVAVVPSAFGDGGTPSDICHSTDTSNPLVQGYCTPIVPTTPTTSTPTAPPCAPGQVTTTSSTVNGLTTTVSSDGCTTTTTESCAAGGGGTQTTTVGPGGTTTTGTMPVCTTTTTTPTVTSGVAGASHTAPGKGVAPAVSTKPASAVKTPAKAVAPVVATKKVSTLPFTGAQLTLFLLVGLGLVGIGVALRMSARSRGND